MIVIKCKNNSDLNSIYHLTKAFFPDQKIKQQMDIEQEPQLELTLNGGSCFIVLPEEVPINEEKALLKKVYRYWSEYTGRTLPWGILTGVRPTKLAMKLIREQENEVVEKIAVKKLVAGKMVAEKLVAEKVVAEKLERILCDKYFLSKEKAKLALEVARRERKLLETLDLEDGFSLYISIPFCPSICSYCSFGSGELGNWQEQVDEYVEKLCNEIDETGRRVAKENKVLNTIYMGGGTPTTLNVEQLEKLFAVIKQSFSLEQLIEYTVEAGRPETITKEKLRLFKREGVTRISINPQSMNQLTLEKVGRNHKVTDIVEAFKLARREGFDNINMDLIIGLSGEGVPEILSTLRQIKELEPDSLTVHTLAMKRGSETSNEYKEKVETKNINQMLNLCYDAAKAMGLMPYYLYRQKNIAGNFENVGFAKVDKAGIYNILIIEEVQTILGVGVGATTKMVTRNKGEVGRDQVSHHEEGNPLIRRRANTKDIGKYLAEGYRNATEYLLDD